MRPDRSLARVFLGFDSREAIAFHVLHQSLITRSSIPISVTPLALNTLADWHQRPVDPRQSTEFAFTRFLTPALCRFKGWAIFMDCDMIVSRDIAELWELRDSRYAVQVVKHDYTPTTAEKFLHQPQTVYPKKNWSSVILFNNARCRALTPAYVNTASGLDLHQFKWLESEELIGSLPPEWNHLVGEQPTNSSVPVANAHFTIGGPYFSDYANSDYATEWLREAVQAFVGLEQPMLDRLTRILPAVTTNGLTDTRQ